MSAAVDRAIPQATGRSDVDERMRELLSRPDPGPLAERLVLLHFRGRRTGRRFDLVAGLHRLSGIPVIATGSAWRHNFTGGLAAEITWRGRRRPVRLVLERSVEEVVRGYAELITRYGAADAQRRLGIAINVDRAPSSDELRDAISRCGLSLVWVEMEEGAA